MKSGRECGHVAVVESGVGVEKKDGRKNGADHQPCVSRHRRESETKKKCLTFFGREAKKIQKKKESERRENLEVIER